MSFESAFLTVLKFEGGFVNNPNDPGGATNFGVTQKTYDLFCDKMHIPKREVTKISSLEVKQIYLSFWRSASCDKFERTHPNTAEVHFDFSINAGISQANKSLQRVINARPIDGIIGRITLAQLLSLDDTSVALSYLNERDRFYESLAERKSVLKEFLPGWKKRVNKLRSIINDRSKGTDRTDPSSSPR